MEIRANALACFVVGLVSMGAVSTAEGGDEKTLPANACTWMWEEYLGTAVDRPTYAGSGWVQNGDSSGFQAFSCPVVRDDTGGGDGNIENLEVYVRDTHGTFQVQCRVYHNDGNSSAQEYGSADGSGAEYDTLTPSIPGTDYTEGLYNIYCTVPPGSYIRAYWWEE